MGGWVRERNGNFYIRWRELDGTPREKAVGKVGKRRAQYLADQRAAEVQRGEYVYSHRDKVCDAWKEFAAQEFPSLKPGTVIGYDRAWRLYWEPVIGDMRLIDLNSRIIQEHLWGFYNLEPSTRALMLVKLSGFLSWAVRTDRIPKNPARDVTRPKEHKVYEPAISPANWELLQELLPERYRVHLCVLYYTGIRVGELRALQWDDVRYGTKWFISKTVFRRGEYALKETGKPFSTPKTNESIRWVHVPMRLNDMLNEWKEFGWWRDCPNPCDLVFPTVYGNPTNEAELGRTFNEAVKDLRAHLEGEVMELSDPLPSKMTLHSLRAGYARMMLEHGMTITELRHQLGHADIRTTLGYAREDFTHAPDALYKMNRSITRLPSVLRAVSDDPSVGQSVGQVSEDRPEYHI